MKVFLALLMSWFVVGFGQPAWIPALAPMAACVGYAIFWRQLLNIESNLKKFLVGSFWFCLVQVIQLSWMTSIEFQGAYIIFVYVLLCIALGIQFGCISALIDKIPHVTVAALWTLMEWARLYFLCGFSWNPIGLSLTASNASMQMASLFGVMGLSFWVVLTNLAALKRQWGVWMGLAVFPYLFGMGHLFFHAKAMEKSPYLSVALVQTGLIPSQKIVFTGREKEFISPYDQWQRIVGLLKAKEQKFDLIVLPESVVSVPAEAKVYSFDMTRRILEETIGGDIIPFLPIQGKEEKVSNQFWMHTIADFFSADVIAGMDSLDKDHIFSSAFYVKPHSQEMYRYEKQVLVPLAEYLPFAWLKRFTEKYGIVDFFTQGKECKVFHAKVPLSISICYEETFGHLIREGRRKGAELFVNVSNDNWYPSSHLPKQHFDHGRIRSVENGVPVVRACNTGVTAVIDSLGRTVAKIEGEEKTEVLVASLPTYHYRTLYMFWGNGGMIGCCLLFFLIAYFGSRKSAGMLSKKQS